MYSGKGFWGTNWTGAAIVGPEPMDRRLTVKEGIHILPQLEHLIPQEIQQQILAVMLDPRKDDQLMCTLSDNGTFSTKKIAQLLHVPGNSRRSVKLTCHKSVQPKIATFLWKLCRHAIPVDTRVQSRRVVMASRCRCCANAQVESIPHLFLHSQVARETWGCFEKIFRLPTQYYSILYVLTVWMKIRSTPFQFELCRLGAAAHVLHEI